MREDLFTNEELRSLRLLGSRIRDKKVIARLQEKLAETFYQEMTIDQQCKWLREQARLHGQACNKPGYLAAGFAIGCVLVIVVSPISEGLGIFLFLVVLSFSIYLSCKDNTYFLKNAFLQEVLKLELPLQKALRETAEKERQELEEKIRIATSKSLEIFEEIKKNPNLNIARFPEYKSYVDIEIAMASPGQQYLFKKHGEREALNELLLRFAGTWAKGYTPVNDQKFTPMLNLLEREMKRVKELTQYTRLPFQVIEHYQEMARTYYGLHREGGSASIYDEQKITNEILAIKDSLVVHGDYIDRSVSNNHSVTHNTSIENAVIDSGDFGDEKIKKEIFRLILSNADESASRVELMGAIPVKESRLLAALEDLQQSQKIQIGNRESGEIVYKLDRLA